MPARPRLASSSIASLRSHRALFRVPTYAYACPACLKGFEAVGSIHDRWKTCECGSQAERRPSSGIPYIKGETVARDIPDPVYKQEREKRDLNQSWGDASRSVEMMRKHISLDEKGQKQLNTAAMNQEGAA